MCRLAAELEEDGQLAAAAEMYRAAMAAAGPKAEICFQVAELLYRQGDLGGARERYYMAIELDEDYVEARANLGCVLAETGQRELAVAAFEGALRYHPDYADVHYHLARTLDEMQRARPGRGALAGVSGPSARQPLGRRGPQPAGMLMMRTSQIVSVTRPLYALQHTILRRAPRRRSVLGRKDTFRHEPDSPRPAEPLRSALAVLRRAPVRPFLARVCRASQRSGARPDRRK